MAVRGRRHPERTRHEHVTSLWLDRCAGVADDDLDEVLGSPDLGAVVVGAGLTGMVTSLLLARAGVRVACVEARTLGAVTTGRTTGKVSLLQGTHLSRIRRHRSRAETTAFLDASREGMAWLLRFCSEHGVDVQRRDAVTYAASRDELDAVEEEHEVAATLGLPVRWCERLDVPFPHHGATVLADQAQLDAMEVLVALAAALRAHGGTLHQGQRVSGVSVPRTDPAGRVAVRLADGRVLRAAHVVLATGTPILDRGLHAARLEPQRSYVLALAGGPHLTAMYLSAGADARSVRDAPGGTLLVGGSGHVVGRTRSEQAHLDRLADWASRHYPGTSQTHAWSAQDYRTNDGLPHLDHLPGTGGRVRVATGYEKWGMTGAVLAARASSAAVLGAEPPWAAALRHRPPSLAGAVGTARINAGVGLSVVRGLGRLARERLGPDSGPSAASCGVVGVCTHLGGLLRWNDVEQTWDCPLHGSRFDRHGEVLEGPATRPLLHRPGTEP